jgi:hypothetical protein
MKKALLTAIIIGFCSLAQAGEPAKVLLFGTFHFKDAGKDMVKVEDINVFTEESQTYLEALTDRLADFKPTAVLLEYNPDSEDLMNERYQAYLSEEYELGANEIYQLGFRIARKAGLERVHSFDNREIPWNAEPVFELAKKQDVPEMATLQALYAEITADEEKARASLSLQQMLARSNDPERDRLNMGSYLITNSVGAGGVFEGADASASWWHRNFRMYGIVQKHAQPGSRVIAIGGSGHTAILKHLLSIDSQREAVPVLPFIVNE